MNCSSISDRYIMEIFNLSLKCLFRCFYIDFCNVQFILINKKLIFHTIESYRKKEFVARTPYGVYDFNMKMVGF